MNFSRNQILFGVFLVAALVVLGHYANLYSVTGFSSDVDINGKPYTVATFVVEQADGVQSQVMPNQSVKLDNGDTLVPKDTVRIEFEPMRPYWTVSVGAPVEPLGFNGFTTFSLETTAYTSFQSPKVSAPYKIRVYVNDKQYGAEKVVDAFESGSTVDVFGDGKVLINGFGLLTTGYVAPTTSDVILLDYKPISGDQLGNKFTLVKESIFRGQYMAPKTDIGLGGFTSFQGWYCIGGQCTTDFRRCTYNRDAAGRSACGWSGIEYPSGFGYAQPDQFTTDLNYPFGDGQLKGLLPFGSYKNLVTVKISQDVLGYSTILAANGEPSVGVVKFDSMTVTTGYSAQVCSDVKNLAPAKGSFVVTITSPGLSIAVPTQTVPYNAGETKSVCSAITAGKVAGEQCVTISAQDTNSGKRSTATGCLTVEALKTDIGGNPVDVKGSSVTGELQGGSQPTSAGAAGDTGGKPDNTMFYVLIGVIVLVVVGYFLTKKPQGKR